MPLDEVLPDLFISGLHSTKRHFLDKKGIKTVLTIREFALPFEPNCDIVYHQVNITDTADQDLFKHFSNIVDIICSGLQRGKVLVHCQAGMSRSVSGIISYMISVFKLDYQTALKVIRENHPMSFPNPGFGKQLGSWEQHTKPSWTATPAYLYHRDKILDQANTTQFSTITKILEGRK